MKSNGRLILFTSYAPGAGKTFEMLNYAGVLSKKFHVIYGYINHQPKRAFTKRYEPVSLSSQRNQAYLNVHKIILVHPDYVVVDELAYYNTYTKHRLYVDVKDLLQAGISVITCCNLRSFKRVNDRYAKETKIRFNNPIPDNYFENIHEVRFVDIDACHLRERYRSGKLFSNKSKILDRYFELSILQKCRSIAQEELINYEREYSNITVVR